jgi:hypothetical protein
MHAADPLQVEARFTQGRVTVAAKLNDAGPFWFLLDSACTIATVHPDLVDELALQQRGFVRIHGIAGVERAPTYPNVTFDFTGARHQPRRIAAIPSEREDSRRRRDGVIGSSLFNQFVVEIDGPGKTLKLHSATNFSYSGEGQIVPFRFQAEIPVLKAAIFYPGKDPIESEFELDTGCDSGLCLGSHFVSAHKLLDGAQTRADEKFGVGGSTETRNGTVPALRLGNFEIKDAQTDFFLAGSPVDEPLAGHLGMGILKRYRVIVDYPRKRLIIE